MKTMKMRTNKSQRGFSLLELMIAASIGLIVILAMTSLFRTGINTTFTVTQRAEVQQNMRAAVEMMTKDLSMAGAGLPSGGLQLPPAPSLVACNQGGTCYISGDVYPTGNFMYGILPGFANGVQSGTVITSAPGAVNDSITSIYCDYNFPLTNFGFTFDAGGDQATINVVNTATIPNNILAPGGLQVGDLVLFLVTTPGNGKTSQGTSNAQTAATVAEITGLPAGGATINFAASDALNFNQSASSANSLASVVKTLGVNLGSGAGGNNITACRLEAVSYFLQVPPAGGTVQTPRLMRQVNGLTAVPVADNIINMQFSYDVIDSTSHTMSANQSNPIAAGLSPALIQKVNIWVMGQGVMPQGGKAQSMYLASSVSARNMSFCNAYSASTTACN